MVSLWPARRSNFCRQDSHSSRCAATEFDSADADKYLTFWKDYFQGKWAATITEGANSGLEKTGTKRTWTCRLGPTEKCMTFAGTSAGKPSNDALAGYDPRTKAWKEVFFFADGSHLIQFYRISAGALSGDPAGKVIPGTAELVTGDGRIEKCRIQVKVIDGNSCEYSCTERQMEDEELPDLVWRFERKKRR